MIAAGSAGITPVIAYAPLLVATGGLITALITAFSRRDKKAMDVLTAQDARTNTAIRGLTEAYDRLETERVRLEKERDEWQQRAEAAETELAASRTPKRKSPHAESSPGT